MDRDDTPITQRTTAVVMVGIIHLLLGWLMMRAGVVSIPDVSIAGDDRALQVVWISAAPTRPVSPAPPVTPQALRDAVPRITRRPPPDAASSEVASSIDAETSTPSDKPDQPAPATATANAPLSATFIEQALRSARQPPVATDFIRSPLQNRISVLPGRTADTFRMRAPVTPAALVESLGRLFGGGPSSPCTHLPEDIAALATRGDSAALQDAMAQRAAHCR